MTKHLTTAQVEHFKEQGYAFPFRAMSTEKAAEYRARIEAYEAHVGADANLSLKIKAHLASRHSLSWLAILASWMPLKI